MIGIGIITHGNIGKEMLNTVSKILPDVTNIKSLAIQSDLPPKANRELIKKMIDSIDIGKGTILLVDMFGGTPSNLCLPFLEADKVEIISGVNLPMIIKIASKREKMKINELADFIKHYGQKNIVIASEVLEGRIEYN